MHELKKLRESLGLTGKEMAAKLGVSLSSLYNYENGRTAVPENILEKIRGESGVKKPEKAAGKSKKKPAAKKASAKARETSKNREPNVIIEAMLGGQINIREVEKRVKKAAKGATVTGIYIKPEENRAYFVCDDGEKSIELW